MAIFNFFKAPKIRQYHHEYIYYDPDKEKREERLARMRAEIAAEKEVDAKPQPLLRKGTFQEKRTYNSAANKSRNIRLALLICVVVALIMFYMR